MNDGDDIFSQVVRDTRDQIDKLRETHYTTDEQIQEYNEVVDEIKETIHDLYRSVDVIKRNDNDFGAIKEHEVKELEQSLNTLMDTQKIRSQQIEEEDFVSNFNGDKKATHINESLQQQMFHDQSEQLDTIHLTMGQLQQQARTMGDELRDQSELLDNLDEGMDTIGGKLSRGRRRLEWIYEKNREKWNDCCIVLLISALIVLLVMAIFI